MNDRHPSGYSAPATTPYGADFYAAPPQPTPDAYGAQQGYEGYEGYPGYEAYGTGSYDTYPGPAYDTGAYDTGAYDTGAYATGTYPTSGYAYESGAYDGGAYEGGAYDTGGCPVAGWDTGAYPAGAYDTGAYDTGAYDTGSYETAAYSTGAYETVGHDPAAYDTGSYPTTGWDPGWDAGWDTGAQQQYAAYDEYAPAPDPYDTGACPAIEDAPYEPEPGPAPEPAPAAPHHPRSAARRRPKPRRSALLTVAVPSVCVMGVAGAAAVNVMGGDGGTEVQAEDTAAQVDTAAAPANQKLDSQLADLSRGADGFADRASRAQERVDLKQRQAAERERKRKEAARREAMRPKYVLPVAQHGLSALFGASGLNWMNLHSGIDFPVQVGTPVRSATDGTIVAKINPSYGNVAEVTMDDGTKILYAHLSSIKIRTGRVKAGQVIAYSGDTGNSTGPHLHFEVRPNGESAVDPLPWLRARGLNPE